jgi:hypothetical protein
VAINPVTSNVLYTSYTDGGSNHVTIVRGVDGTLVNTLPPEDEFGIAQIAGVVPLSQVGVADDGVIYACGVTLDYSGSPFLIYRWADENATNLTLAYIGTSPTFSSYRIGDSFDVRGGGTNTQIVVSGKTPGADTVLFTTTDGINFTANELGTAAGVVFEESLGFGEGDTLLGKDWFGSGGSASNLHRASFTIDGFGGGSVSLVANVAVPNKMGDVALDTDSDLLAAVITAQITGTATSSFQIYDFADPDNPVLLMSELFPANNFNPDGTSAADAEGDLFVGLDVNNGIVCYQFLGFATNAPTILTQPSDVTVYEGTIPVTFAVDAIGSQPLSYQWFFDASPIPGATNSSYALANPGLADEGIYSVTISNIAGTATSSDATLTVLPSFQTAVLTELWSLSPGDRPYLTTASLERGLAYNPATTNLLLVGRSGAPTVYVLDAETGADLHSLNNGAGIISGGVFTMNLVGAAADGAVYVCNLTTDASGSPLRIYRWADDDPATTPTVAFSGDPSAGLLAGSAQQRWGDTLDVRGSGTSTQIILACRQTNVVCVLTTVDGINFTANAVQVAGAPTDPGNGFAGLGLTFGEGDTFWGKTVGSTNIAGLRQVAFALTNTISVGTVVREHSTSVVPSSMSAIGVDPVRALLAGIALETPDNLRLYDLADSPLTLPLLDQDFWSTDNSNLNGTGAVDFGPNRIFALDSNNGILAMSLNAGAIPFEILSIEEAAGPSVVLTWESRPGVDYNVLSKDALPGGSWVTNSGPVTATGLTTSSTNSQSGSSTRFYQIEAP